MYLDVQASLKSRYKVIVIIYFDISVSPRRTFGINDPPGQTDASSMRIYGLLTGPDESTQE